MNLDFDPIQHPHRRFNPLLKEWVLVSPHRAKRPWQGQVEDIVPLSGNSYDSECYLCPGNKRVTGDVNDDYSDVYVFTNDHPALQEQTPLYTEQHALFRVESEQGTCKVICYSPDHSKTLPMLATQDIGKVINLWVQQCEELRHKYQSIQIFENKGAVMGCSNPHPHGQIWAQTHIPTIVQKKQNAQLDYLFETNSNLLQDYVSLELSKKERVVVANEDWVVVVPFWAAWPFETLLLPRSRISRFIELSSENVNTLADILKKITTCYDNLFNCSFPYSMGWHGAPYDNVQHPEWTLHATFFPPLLRSATVKKFMVGYEMLAESQRDITPEQAAQRLRETSDIHYSEVKLNA